MSEETIILTVEQMLSMIGISESEYTERMQNKKHNVGVATKANINKVVECIKSESFLHFGCDFSEIQNFKPKAIHERLKNFMKRQDERPSGLEIGSFRRGRKRPRCK